MAALYCNHDSVTPGRHEFSNEDRKESAKYSTKQLLPGGVADPSRWQTGPIFALAEAFNPDNRPKAPSSALNAPLRGVKAPLLSAREYT